MNSLHGKVSSLSITHPKKEDSEDIILCPICQEKAEKTCSACKSVAYCCVDHQKLDWKNHQKVCQPFIIKKTEDMGMGWFATRDLKPGFVVFEESPVIEAPGFNWNWQSGSLFTDNFTKCLVCGAKMSSIRECSTCSWPVCSEECEKNPIHMDNECQEFVSRKLKYPPSRHWPFGMLALCIRANKMKALDPQKFEQLMNLQDFYSIPSENQELQKLELPPGMFEALSGPTSLGRQEFRKLLRIFKVNTFKYGSSDSDSEIPGPVPDHNFGIFLKASRMNHSCFSNCTTIFGQGPAYKLRIYTSIPVSNGEQLYFNYFERYSILPTELRQCIIQQGGFICKCKRCLDPTELGTFLSGIKCSSCSRHLTADSETDDVGFLLPVNPLDVESDDRKYECHRCHFKVPFHSVMSSVPQPVQRVFQSPLNWMDPTVKDIAYLETFLNIHEESRHFKDYLHPNHFVIQVAMRSVIKKQQEGKLNNWTQRDLKRRVSRLEFLLMIDDKLFPGWSPFRREDLTMLQNTITTVVLGWRHNKPEEDELEQKFLKAWVEQLKFVDQEVFQLPEKEQQDVPTDLKKSPWWIDLLESLGA